MHKTEEERYEFDINIEGNLHTISILEPIYRKIQNMTVEEKSRFKLPVGLGKGFLKANHIQICQTKHLIIGFNSTIYQRVIKKIYETGHGLEVIDALHNNPCVAVPVVLKRLKQKDEEWKRCQVRSCIIFSILVMVLTGISVFKRDWNKIWKEVESRNYQKSLDHQGVTFKAADKKLISTKTFMAEIKGFAETQREELKRLIASPQEIPRDAALRHATFSTHQLEYLFKDPEIFRDARKLIMSQVTNTHAISHANEDRIGEFLGTFVRRFYFVESYDDLSAFSSPEDEGEEGIEDDGQIVRGRSLTRSKSSDVEDESSGQNGLSKASGGLRREVLVKAAGAAGTETDKLRAGQPTKRAESVDSDDASVISTSSVNGTDNGSKRSLSLDESKTKVGHERSLHRSRRTAFAFYANSTFYCFFRLYEV
jgi:paired amphipathic helix protein Sin3a